MSFESPWFLALLVLVPLAAAGYVSLAGWRRRAAARFAPGQRLNSLSPDLSATRRTLKAGLVVAALGAIVIALARPHFGQNEVVVEQAGADVVIALDVSRSMFADDVAPTRLARAQEETLALLDRLRGRRIGLVIFGRSAVLRSPLTTDVTPLGALVQSGGQDSVLLEPGSDLGAAIRAAQRALEAGEAQGRAIVLVSDGEDHEGDALSAASDAAGRGVLLFAAGVGTAAGAPVPPLDPATGLPFTVPPLEAEPGPVSRLDDALLRQAVSTTPGGRYVPVDELPSLAESIAGLQPTPFAADRQQQPVERFQWVVLAALALLALEAALPERRGRLWPRPAVFRALTARSAGRVAALALLGLLVVACGRGASDLIDEGNRAYERGDYSDALESYLRAGAAAPDRPEPHVNAGIALHRLERYGEAAAESARALPVEDPELAAQAHYNLGNHYVLMGRHVEALASYRQALLLDPDDRDAKHNLELTLALLKQLQTDGTAEGGEHAAGDPDLDPEAPGEGDEQGDGAGTAGDDRAAQAEAVERTLAEALAGIEEEFTIEQALRALDMVQELYRLRPLVEADGAAGPDQRPDY